MKEYETLTREKVDVVPFGCGMPETHLMQDWSDRMLDLILNGPTINGIKKDEVRAMLRETYAALKQYEKIGPMASPFMNDPTAIVALAEIGDKTQLLAFILAAKFRKPVPIIAGILVATLVNHGFAGAVGTWVTTLVGPETLRWVLGVSFIAMAIWTLIPDKFEEDDAKSAVELG